MLSTFNTRGVASPRCLFRQRIHYLPHLGVPLVLPQTKVMTFFTQKGKTNLSRDGLNPAHVPRLWVNNPTLAIYCGSMMRRADIEGSKSNVDKDSWLPQASYPCGNFSDTSKLKFKAIKDR